LPRKDIQASDDFQKETSNVKILAAITSCVGVATILFAGYVCLKAIPDLGRYVKISRM
jgi:hypothetical protein